MQDGARFGDAVAGKVAIVTGAASGIGRATALLFSAQGARVLVADIDEEGVAAVRGECETMARERAVRSGSGSLASPPPVAVAVTVDISDEGATANMVQTCVDTFGRIDIFVANAGVLGPVGTPIHELESDDIARVFRVNAVGTLQGIARVVACMQRQQRSSAPQSPMAIVCVASVAGLRSGAGDIAYSASKAAVVSFVQTIANELTAGNDASRASPIRINAVAPGIVETGMTSPMFVAARARGTAGKIGQLNPLRRAGTCAEIARVILFLGSDDSSYVNGQTLAVDGGLSSSHPVKLHRNNSTSRL